MQTFLPYPDFEKSLHCLDWRRLNCQQKEARQIYEAITDKESRNFKRWGNHPAVRMWQGYPDALAKYHNLAIREWRRRGYQTVRENILIYNFNDIEYPPWFGNDRFHSAHRAALLFKDYEWYKQFNWSEEPKLDYYWPV